MTTLEVLIAARAKLMEGWCKGTAFLDAAGKECGEPDATCWCSIAACNVVCGGEYIHADSAMDILCKLVPSGAISVWQDVPERTLDQVVSLFDQAIDIARREAA